MHTQLDRQAFIEAGFTEDEIANRESRENSMRCPFHDHRHPVTTFNLSGFCDEHYRPPSLHKADPCGAGLIAIEGSDNAGWTAEDYVVPRLQSGLYAAEVVR